MIGTKEIMIGDLVYNSNHEVCKVYSISNIFESKIYLDNLQKDDGCFEVACEVEPIPITPEILKKNGFELKPDGWIWCQESSIEDKNYIFIQFRKGCDEVRLVELNFVNKVLAKHEQMHYVHELQHSLRFCRIKKEIIV